MKILYIDIASKNGTLACVTPERVVALRTIDTKISDAELPALLESIWKEAGWAPKDLTHIACAIGPGGFMSLRVGVSTANALAWALGIPSCGIHLSDLYLARTTTHYSLQTTQFVWIHSTKRAEVFMQLPGEEPMHATIEDAVKKMPNNAQWIGELMPEHVELFANAGHKAATLCPLEEILPEFLASQSYERQTLMPWYGREG